MSFEKLDKINLKIQSLDHALAMLQADEATHMPTGGGEMRAEAVSTLAGLRHEMASAPHIADLINDAQNEQLSAEKMLALAEYGRVYSHLVCLPAEFVSHQSKNAMHSEQAWRELRPSGDWDGFRPALENVVTLVREEAAMRADKTGLAPYDALMEQYDPGNRSADLNPIFDSLKSFLTEFLPEALEAQNRRLTTRPLKPIPHPVSIEKQRALGLAVMGPVGFDFDHGRLDTSHHPFCGGVPTDVRMTTRYDENDFLPSFMGVLHETGHAQYEQGLQKTKTHWPHTLARGMGAHESQSLFVEMQIARSPEFWHWVRPMVDQQLGPEVLSGFSTDEILAHVNKVERGFIRVDADEVTYPLHVILRYEMEQALVTGQIEAKDIPEVWDEKMHKSLGLRTLDQPKNGPMQDVHWPAGLFGYFPSYTLGAMMAAQQWAALETDQPSIKTDIANGNFSTVNTWRHDNIWSKGSRWPTPELMRHATGATLNPDYFIAHLKNRYL